MQVPFVDLNQQYKEIKREVERSIVQVFKDAKFVNGKEVEKFEDEFREYLGSRNCISTNSGTDALLLGIRGLRLPQGSEVIIPVNTFIASAVAISENRLKPVFVDIDEKDNGVNLADLRKKITSRTSAILVVHLYGLPDKLDEIRSILKKAGRKIYIIEDACQAHGAIYKKKKVGTFGIFSAFSFYPTKNLGAYGDGGMISTNDGVLAKRYRLLKEYGQIKKYHHESLGINSRLDTLQAAVLRIKLKYLDRWNLQRSQLAHYYRKSLSSTSPDILLPAEFEDRRSVFHLYVVRVKKRNKLIRYLTKKNISTLIHYPLPLHLQKAYSYLGYTRGEFPIAEKVSSEIVSLPMYPELSKKQVDYVVRQIKTFFN